MPFPELFQDLDEDLRELEKAGLLRSRRILESAQGPRIRVDGRDYLAFCSNDYLGLANHPGVIEAASRGAATYGVGAGASHLIVGHSEAHHHLEQSLAQFTGLPQALLFSTGYMANMGVVTALLGRNDVVIADKLNHASLNDAAILSRARFERYGHADLGQLERLLIATRGKRRLVVTDAVFSMDGDIAPVPELLELCERHDAYLMIDDAHGFGVLGEHGRGTLEYFNLSSRRIIYMATLGKAAGVFGAFVAGSEALIQTLIQRARTYVYTTAFPPMLATALQASIGIIKEEKWRRDQLTKLANYLREHLQLDSWHLMPSMTPIQPLVIGGNHEAVKVSERLQEYGILVPAIRPPTVPKGQARLRITFSAAHDKDDVRKLVEALTDIAESM